MSVSTHPGQQLNISMLLHYKSRLGSPVDLKTSILSRQTLCQSDDECFTDAISVLLETSLGLLILADERLQI
jgi:hypothetical protein